jgi:ATP-dependent Clp protease adaptor protein ClpS
MKCFDKMKDQLLEWLNLKPDMIAPWTGGPLNDKSVPFEQAYCIELLNDDFTPMEFVVLVVMTYFEMDKESAIQLMLEVHTNGFAKIGHSSREIMESFAVHLNAEARRREYPLFVRSVLK